MVQAWLTGLGELESTVEKLFRDLTVVVHRIPLLRQDGALLGSFVESESANWKFTFHGEDHGESRFLILKSLAKCSSSPGCTEEEILRIAVREFLQPVDLYNSKHS